MALNAIGNSISLVDLTGQQDTYEDLIISNIQWAGVDVNYLIRERVNEDVLFGESTLSEFKDYIIIEMMIESMNNFNGDGTLFTKFGYENTDGMSLIVSLKRFKEEGQKMGLDVPRQGDLIYLPFSDSLWEIKWVKLDESYYQFGKNYTYRLSCSLFQYSHEELPNTDDFNDFNTNYTKGDIINEDPLKMLLGLHDFQDSEYSGYANSREENVDESEFAERDKNNLGWDVDDPFSGKC